jgi:hypothetical protein
MRDEPRLQLRVLCADGVKDDDLVCLDEAADVEDSGEDDMFPYEDCRHEVGRHRVYTSEISRLTNQNKRRISMCHGIWAE